MPDAPASTGNDRGVLGRAAGVVFSPRETLIEVASRPSPAGVLFVACLVIGLATGLPQLTERGRAAALDAQVDALERFSGQPVTGAMYAQLERQSHFGPYMAFAGTFVMLPVMSVVLAAVLWAACNVLFGGTAGFKTVLAIVTHSQTIGALGAVAAMPIQYVQGIQSMAGPFNLGVLAPMLEPGRFGAAFLSSIGIFMLWQLVVIAIGLGVLYQRRTGGIAAALVASYLVLAAIIAGAFSSFTGGRG